MQALRQQQARSCRGAAALSFCNASTASCRRSRALTVRPAAFFDFLKGALTPTSKPKTNKTVAELLQAVEPTQRGLATSKEDAEAIMALVEELQAQSESEVTTGPTLSGTWKLLWTTEKETLWILKNAGIFGTSAGDVYQVIDTEEGTLQNVIEFPPEGAFIVDSAIAVDGPQRVAFNFTGAKLMLPSRDVGLPPFGKGWFDNVYVDANLRVARDSRGDTLIVARDGPPRRFE